MKSDVEQGHQNRPPAATRTSLINKELGVNWARLNSLDLFWKEKLWALFDALQIFGLLWSLSQPWPWPKSWLAGTRWTVAINLDFVSMHDAAMEVTGPGTQSAPWGEISGYMLYASVLLLIPVGLATLWHFRKKLAIMWLDHRFPVLHRHHLWKENDNNYYHQRLQLLVSTSLTFERMILLAAHLLYLPVVLAVIRLVLCDDIDGTLSVDPRTSCHSVSLICSALFGITIVISFTMYLHHRAAGAVKAVVIYKHPSDHERFLQRVEIEYALDLCNAWATDHLWVVSSFRLHAARYRLEDR